MIILGPESTGKTSLGAWLSKRYNGLFVEEYARTYFETHNINQYGQETIDLIYRRQLDMEDAILKIAGDRLCVVDGSFITARIWSQEVFGKVSPFIEAQYKSEMTDVYLLTEIDLPWIEDGQRKNQHNRDYLFQLFENHLQQKGLPYFRVNGTGDSRYEMADRVLRTFLKV